MKQAKISEKPNKRTWAFTRALGNFSFKRAWAFTRAQIKAGVNKSVKSKNPTADS